MRPLAAGLVLLLATATAQARCTGDCGGGGLAVTIDELLLGVNVALGVAPPAACPAYPECDLSPVCVADLIGAVRNALDGCPPPELPALVASEPAAGAVDVPRTTWVRLEFAAAVDPADFSELVRLVCLDDSGAAGAVRITALSPTVLAVDPLDPGPRAGAPCSLELPGVAIPFTVAAAGAPATIHYDRGDARNLSPLPDDAFFVADGAGGGRLAIPVPDAPDDVREIFAGLLLGDGARLTGFSPLAFWVIELSDAADAGSVPLKPAASLDPLATMRLIDVTAGAATHGQRIPFRVEPRSDTSVMGVVSHTLLLFPSIPLTEHHQYGLVVTNRVLADATRPFAPSAAMAPCLGDTYPETVECARIHGVAEQVLAAAAVHGPPLDPEDVALVVRATVGATSPIADDQVAVREEMAAGAPPGYTIAEVAAGTAGPVAAVVSGTWEAPDWREGNTFKRDPAGRPVRTRTRPVPFTLALPEAARAGPVPIVMYQHGNPGSAENEVPNAARRSLAAAGFAVIGFTDILNREVSPGITDRDQAILAQVTPVLAGILGEGRVPDFWAETRAEQIAFLRFVDGLGGLDVLPLGAPDGIPDLAPERPRMYLGISEGANNGPGILPYAPEIRAAALVAGGARLAEVLVHQADDLFLAVLGGVFPNMTPADIWMGVALFQHLYDRQDAHNHAPFLYRRPVALPGNPPERASVLVLEGLDDSLVPNHATDSLAWSLGPLPHLAPVQRPVPFLEVVEGSLQGNLGAGRSGAFYQYVPTGVAGIDPTPGCAALAPAIGGEGHYCPQSAAESFHQRAVFFTTALAGPPLIIDPLAAGAMAPVGMTAAELAR